MATKLSVYNNALVKHLGERKLNLLTDVRKSRRVLDTIWDSDFVKGCLEDGQWNFATKSVVIDFDPDIITDSGLKYAFTKPSDWVRTVKLSTDQYFNNNLLDYEDEDQNIYSDEQSIYMKYVSDDNAYGMDLTNWPQSFTNYAETKLAREGSMAITQDRELQILLIQKEDKALSKARSKDALNEPMKTKQFSSWVGSRFSGRRSNRYGRGGF